MLLADMLVYNSKRLATNPYNAFLRAIPRPSRRQQIQLCNTQTQTEAFCLKSEALPLAKDTPPSTPIGQHEAPPSSPFAHLDNCLPR